MSNNYGLNLTPGQIRTRIRYLSGQNPNPSEEPGAFPSMIFNEEYSILLATPDPITGATEKTIGKGRDIVVQYNPSKNVDIRNPGNDVNQPIGRLPISLTMAECYVVLYSLGRQAQTDRDIMETLQATAQVAAQTEREVAAIRAAQEAAAQAEREAAAAQAAQEAATQAEREAALQAEQDAAAQAAREVAAILQAEQEAAARAAQEAAARAAQEASTYII